MDQPDIAAAITTLGWLEFIKRVGGIMVIAGVAIEVGGDWISTPFHKKVEDARQLELSKLNNEAARLTSENLALQKIIQPRRFPSLVELGVLPNVEVPGAPFFNFIRAHKDTPVAIQAVPDFEALTLANDMISALSAFGWKPELVTEAQTGVQPLHIEEGVWVSFPKTGKYRDAARDLAGAFSNIGLTGPMVEGRPSEIHASGYTVKDDGTPLMMSHPGFRPPRDSVFVLIGMKPFPTKRGNPVTGFIKPSAPESVPK